MIWDLTDAVVRGVTQPFRDGYDVLEGLSEGEIRSRAAARLGVDVVAGMTTAELLEWLTEESEPEEFQR